jgi:hypothetical protein
VGYTQKMNVGFYGHSACLYDAKTYNNIPIYVRDMLNCNIVHSGTPQCTEERILFNLKKKIPSNKLNVVVIFHQQHPRYFFVPASKRDFAADVIPESKAQVLWSERIIYDPTIVADEDTFEEEFGVTSDIPNVFKTKENFIEAMHCYKNYFNHQDLLKNRMESAMLMIDTYCLNRNINAIHVTADPKSLGMPWFSFKSGIVSTEIQDMLTQYPSPYGANRNPNSLSLEGSEIIAQKLVDLIREQGWDTVDK